MTYDVSVGGAYAIGKKATPLANINDSDVVIVCMGV
jgi:hypothetical protein